MRLGYRIWRCYMPCRTSYVNWTHNERSLCTQEFLTGTCILPVKIWEGMWKSWFELEVVRWSRRHGRTSFSQAGCWYRIVSRDQGDRQQRNALLWCRQKRDWKLIEVDRIHPLRILEKSWLTVSSRVPSPRSISSRYMHLQGAKCMKLLI